MLDDHSLRVLEFPKVLDIVAGHTHWPPGRERIEALRPAPHMDELNERQAEVAEALRLLEEGHSLPLGGLDDVRPPINLAQRGGTLGPETLLQVREVAVVSRKLGRTIGEKGDTFPRLAWRARYLKQFPRIESEIGRSISADARVMDAASARLRAIRIDIREAESKIQRNLQNLLRDSDMHRMLQEPIVTQRHGRSVLPVKAEHKGKFPGLVIDQSSSGATVFMEPLAVLELSNKLRAHQLAEEKEVEAILHALSGLIGHDANDLLMACEELGHLDSLTAQASYALKVGAILPEVGDDIPVRLSTARHPLLIHKGITPVPITIEVGGSFRTLVITGPNTGGKTVCLKTLGLLSLMASCGMPIPAAPGSTVPLLQQVWADIGDEQSIAQNLSTFSSHVTQILRILPHAKKGTLVLLDELGAGTDPTEGGALGIGLLDHLNQQGAITVITTHLSDLKVYASKTEGFQNAAVEFDASSLSPTFRLIMGVPGKSNALQIASRLGLPDHILRRSREVLGQDHVGVEGLLDDLENERNVVRQIEHRISEEETELRKLRQQYEEKMRTAEQDKARMLDEAAREAERLVAETREQTHGLLRDFRARMTALGKARRDALDEARRYAEQAKAAPEELPPEPTELTDEELERLTRPDNWDEPLEEEEEHPGVTETPPPPAEPTPDDVDIAARVEARGIEAELQALTQRLEPLKEPRRKTLKEAAKLQKDDRVYSRRYGQEGVVLAQKGEKVEVQFGLVRMTVPRDDLEASHAPAPVLGESVLPQSRRMEVSTRLDLRGMTVDESLYEVDRRLDEAVVARMEKLEIIHGKGTGALRMAVQRHLKDHPLVAEQRLGEVYEGGWGVTVVKLKL